MKQKEFDFVEPVKEKNKKKATSPKTVKNEVTVKKEKKVITNYEAYKDIVLKAAASGALCFSCPARSLCDDKAEEKTADYCLEAWTKWASLSYVDNTTKMDIQ